MLDAGHRRRATRLRSSALGHCEPKQARGGPKPEAGEQDPEPQGLDPDPGGLELLQGGLDSDGLRSTPDVFRADLAEFQPAKGGVRREPEGVGLEHDEVESDEVGFTDC